jgi:hypothetical protein
MNSHLAPADILLRVDQVANRIVRRLQDDLLCREVAQ